MIITKKVISRREMLRGIGAMVALPLFDAMVPALSAQAKTAGKPKNDPDNLVLQCKFGPEPFCGAVTPPANPIASTGASVVGKVRSIFRRAWSVVWRVIWDDTGGIDDTALPSGFEARQRRGSRMVRNLWHIPF